jgi:hypothetical protein
MLDLLLTFYSSPRKGVTTPSLVLAAASVLISSAAWGQPDKVIYELKERCGRQAAETFKKEWSSNIVNTKNGQIIAGFENHYSPRFNKCFYLLTATSYEPGKKPYRSLSLFDLHDNKEYATFDDGAVLQCEVREYFCHSEAEWRRLIKPYMED